MQLRKYSFTATPLMTSSANPFSSALISNSINSTEGQYLVSTCSMPVEGHACDTASSTSLTCRGWSHFVPILLIRKLRLRVFPQRKWQKWDFFSLGEGHQNHPGKDWERLNDTKWQGQLVKAEVTLGALSRKESRCWKKAPLVKRNRCTIHSYTTLSWETNTALTHPNCRRE